MARRSGGLKEFAGTKIGTIKCRGCQNETPVKVNKAGWPYVFCAHPPTGCGYQERAQGRTGALVIVKDRFFKGTGRNKKIIIELVEQDGAEE